MEPTGHVSRLDERSLDERLSALAAFGEPVRRALYRYVIRRGEIVARTEPRETTVTWNGREERVDFLRRGTGAGSH